MTSDGLDAVEVIVTLPLALAADRGANFTVKVAPWPAVRVKGVEIPLRLNPVPLITTLEIVSVEPPVLVTVSDRDCLLPTVTLPKFRLVGLAPRPPVPNPVPDNGSDSVGLEASEVMVILPLRFPVVCGANVAVNVVLLDAFSASGVAMPLSLNPLPLTEAFVMLTVDPELLVKVTVWLLWLPTVTLPKLSLAGFTAS